MQKICFTQVRFPTFLGNFSVVVIESPCKDEALRLKVFSTLNHVSHNRRKERCAKLKKRKN